MSRTRRPSHSRFAAAATRVHRRRWLTVLTAMAAATASWAIAVPLLGVDVVVQQGSEPLPVSALLGPLAAADATATAVLIGLHCLVGAILIVGLPQARASRPPGPPSPTEPQAESEPTRSPVNS